MPACIRATELLPPCFRTSDSCFSNSGCKEQPNTPIQPKAHIFTRKTIFHKFHTDMKQCYYMTHNEIHTRFCCEAWSRNCCAVSNSVLSSKTIKPNINTTFSMLANLRRIDRCLPQLLSLNSSETYQNVMWNQTICSMTNNTNFLIALYKGQQNRSD